MKTIWIIGDSTVENGSAPFRGWGWAMPEFAAENVRVENWARAGRSSLSFREEGLFQPVQEGMQKGDILLIQFGHNDEKEEAVCHTDPESTFPETLSWYAGEALKKGVQPVLVTSVCRRYFLPKCDGELLYTHGEYPLAVRKLAKDRGWPLIDLKKSSRRLFLSLKEEKTAELFVHIAPGTHPNFPDGHDDMTHLNAKGAKEIAALVAEEMKTIPELREFVK